MSPRYATLTVTKTIPHASGGYAWRPGDAVRVRLAPEQYPWSTGAFVEPWVVALRKAPGASVCVDEECELSGYHAHVGPCEPCGCSLEHAVEECPDRRTPADIVDERGNLLALRVDPDAFDWQTAVRS
jgi:hypothetical protein